MDDTSGSSIWQRVAKIFHGKNSDTVEKAIREASEEGELDKEEGSMLLRVLTLDDMQVQDIMTPRTDIVCTSSDASIREIVEVITASGHSRIPVFMENKDNMVGIIYAKDLLSTALIESTLDTAAKSIMREAFFVPETKSVLALLEEFKSRKQHLAIILDEYGGTAGLVSIEDVIEQIVGDIEDEHDAPRTAEIVQQEDGSYTILGRVHLENLSTTFQVTIESEEVDTIGGYLSLLSGRVPKIGEEFTVKSIKFTVLDADAKQIHSLRVELPLSLSEDNSLSQ